MHAENWDRDVYPFGRKTTILIKIEKNLQGPLLHLYRDTCSCVIYTLKQNQTEPSTCKFFIWFVWFLRETTGYRINREETTCLTSDKHNVFLKVLLRSLLSLEGQMKQFTYDSQPCTFWADFKMICLFSIKGSSRLNSVLLMLPLLDSTAWSHPLSSCV